MNTDTTANQKPIAVEKSSGWKMAGWITLPVVLLFGVILAFLVTDGAGLHIKPVVPIETITFERTILRPGQIEILLRNTSPQPVTISVVNINDAIWPFSAEPTPTIPRLGEATFTLDYQWVTAEPYEITFFSTNSVAFTTTIAAAANTAMPTRATLVSFLLIGLYVGVIPVFLGMVWMPVLKRLGPRWMTFLMAITAGLLLFLGIDASNEALELAGGLGSAFQGVGLVGIGIVLTFLLLDAISRRQALIVRSEANQRLALAFMIATGIGFHNLGEGLAIGASFSQGNLALGTFLVIGFILQNITEGLGIIIPVLKDRPSLKHLVILGLIGGGPAILGSLVGGLIYSQILAVLFLAVGAGAVFEVVYEVAKIISKDSTRRPMPGIVFAGITTGMLALYVMGLFVK